MTAQNPTAAPQTTASSGPSGADEIQLPDEYQSQMHRLVLDYLIHHCYQETAMCFSQSLLNTNGGGDSSSSSDFIGASPSTANSKRQHEPFKTGPTLAPSSQKAPVSRPSSMEDIQKDSAMEVEPQAEIITPHPPLNATSSAAIAESLASRKLLMSLLLEGKIKQAIEYCQSHFPSLMAPISAIEQAAISTPHSTSAASSSAPSTPKQVMLAFQLHCQQFIELVRKDQQADALTFAQTTLSPFGLHYPHLLPTLRDIVALIAYQNPADSPVAHYLSLEHRQKVAELVNAAVLSLYGMSDVTTLERLLKQLVVARHVLDTENKSTDKKNSQRYLEISGANNGLQRLVDEIFQSLEI